MNDGIKTRSGKKTVLFRILMCVGITLLGVISMKTLAGMATPPAEKIISEQALPVETTPVHFEDIQTWLYGYGEVTSLNLVTLSPEVSGRVISVHPRLETGEIIPKGEVLFSVDTANDRLSINNGRKRLKILQRNLELTEKEFNRIKNLFLKNKIGTLSEVENAEKAYNSILDQIRQLELSIAASELRVQSSVVTAPFDARIKSVNIEKEQYVSPGSASVTLADDSILEVHVSIDGDKAMRLLQFEPETQSIYRKPFADVKQVPSRVIWTQGDNAVQATGVLHRILEFDATTRTLKLAIRLNPQKSNSEKSPFPIMTGMFCKVEIPGKTLPNVVRLPKEAVKLDNSVHIVVQNRLKTIPVVVEDRNENTALISGGLQQNDLVIVTQITAPLENTLLEPLALDTIARSTGR